MNSFRRPPRWCLFLGLTAQVAIVLNPSPLKAQDAVDQTNPATVESTTTLRSSAQAQAALVTARAELAALRMKYLDGHPLVRQQLAKIAALEKQAAGGGGAATITSIASATPSLLVTLDFPGGSLQQLLDALPKSDSSSFNLVVDDRTVREAEVKVRAFSLRNAPPAAFTAALSLFLADQKLAVEKLIPDQYQNGQLQPGPDIYVVRPPQAAVVHSRFEAFQLSQRLESQSIDEIVGAIRTAWELDPMHDPDGLRLKFHPGTSLLLVSGSSEAIVLASQVIQNLKRPPEQPRNAPAPTPLAK